MKRTTFFLILALSLGVAALGAVIAPWGGSGSPAGASSGGSGVTPLPAGWELCVLQGLGAPADQANVADLDEWQAAEGGSTNNTAAYNPFNTARTTDVNNNPLPVIVSSNGFPAFGDWISGCAATVATILQPNMTSIAAGLKAGNVSPPAAFLAVVDQSQWCAPSANGTPCYSDTILGTNGTLAAAVLAQLDRARPLRQRALGPALLSRSGGGGRRGATGRVDDQRAAVGSPDSALGRPGQGRRRRGGTPALRHQ